MRDDQTERESLGAPEDGREEEQVLKSQSAFKGLEGPGEPHPVTPQTTADGISHVNQEGNNLFQADFEVNPEPTTTQVTVRQVSRLPMGR